MDINDFNPTNPSISSIPLKGKEENLTETQAKNSTEKVNLEILNKIFETPLKSEKKNTAFNFERCERQRQLRMQFAPQYIQDLNWPTSWNSLTLKEAIFYEFSHLFKQMIEETSPLPKEADWLFLNVATDLYNRPLHPKNGTTIDEFVKKLRDILKGSSPHILNREGIKNSIKGLKFFYVAEELSEQMTIHQLRQPDNHQEISSNDDMENWEIAQQLWENLGCFITSLLTVIKEQAQMMDETFSAQEFLNNLKKLRQAKVQLQTSDFFNFEEFCKKINSTRLIRSARGTLLKQYFTTILNALKIKHSGAKEVISFTLKQLRVSLKLLENQTSDLYKMLEKFSSSLELLIPKEQVNIILEKKQREHPYFLQDEKDKPDSIEAVKQCGDLMLEATANLLMANQAIQDYPPLVEKLNQSLLKLSEPQLRLAESLNQLTDTIERAVKVKDQEREKCLMEKGLIFQKARLKPHEEANIEAKIKKTYQLLESTKDDVYLCRLSLNIFLEHIEEFAKRVNCLKMPSQNQEMMENSWWLIQEREEQHLLIKRMVHPSSSSNREETPQATEEKVEVEESERPKAEVPMNNPIVQPLMIQASSVLEQLFSLPLFPKSLLSQKLDPSSIRAKIVKACYQDVHFHLSVLGATIDLIRASQPNQKRSFLPYFARAMVRSLSTLSEQVMTGELLIYNPDTVLDHSHLELAKLCEQESGSKIQSKAYTNYLSQIDWGVVAHRYPQNIRLLQPRNSPTILKLILAQKSLTLLDLQQLMKQALDFLNHHHLIDSSRLSELKSVVEQAFQSTEKPETKKDKTAHSLNRVTQLIQEVEKIITHVDRSKKKRQKTEPLDLWLNIQYHLKGLKEGLKCLQAFPNACHLIMHGDSLLMHLQLLDELTESLLYIRKENHRLQIHDLQAYRELRGHQETAEDAEVVNGLNCGKGDHYPHRQQLELRLDAPEGTIASIPSAISWRLDALQISMHGETYDHGFQPVIYGRKPIQFNSPQALQEHLIHTVTRMMAMISSRFSKS